MPDDERINKMEGIYNALRNIDSDLSSINESFVQSIVRMSHVSLAMRIFGVEEEKKDYNPQIDIMVGNLKKLMASLPMPEHQ